MSTPRTVQQQARALAKAEGIAYMEARRRLLAQNYEPSTPPALPDALAFPRPGTPEFDWWLAEARERRIGLGAAQPLDGPDRSEPPVRGDQPGHASPTRLVLDLARTSHALVHGVTGAGKTRLLTLVATAAICLPEQYSLFVVDGAHRHLSWTQDFDNVEYASGADGIVDLVARAHQEMEMRMSALAGSTAAGFGKATGIGSLIQATIAEVAVIDLSRAERGSLDPFQVTASSADEPAVPDLVRPPTAVLLIDALDAALLMLDPSRRAVVLGQVEEMALWGRAVNVSVILVAQKPSAALLGSRLLSQIGLVLELGPRVNEAVRGVHVVDLYAFDPKAPERAREFRAVRDGRQPPGRGVAKAPSGQYAFQTYWLNDQASPPPWDQAGRSQAGAVDITRGQVQRRG